MNDGQRAYLVTAYMGTPADQDIALPDDIDAQDAVIFLAHLLEIGYAAGHTGTGRE